MVCSNETRLLLILNFHFWNHFVKHLRLLLQFLLSLWRLKYFFRLFIDILSNICDKVRCDICQQWSYSRFDSRIVVNFFIRFLKIRDEVIFFFHLFVFWSNELFNLLLQISPSCFLNSMSIVFLKSKAVSIDSEILVICKKSPSFKHPFRNWNTIDAWNLYVWVGRRRAVSLHVD